MRTAIIPMLAVFAGLGFGMLAAGQEQGAQQPPPKKDDQTKAPDSKAADGKAPDGKAADGKATDGLTDPAAMAGEKADPAKPVVVGGAPVEKTYIIGAEDVLQIWVIEQRDISMQYPVRPDGIISVPLVGDVKVAGLTTNQVETVIADRLKANEILKDPSVTVAVAASHSRKYYIYGEVNHSGPFDLVVPTRISEALANAGGFKDFAKITKIRVIREVPGKPPLKFLYNDKQVSHGQKLEQNIYLEPGDRIYVD